MKAFVLRLRRFYKGFFAGVDYLRSPFLLAVRLYWGWQLVQSGWGKLHNLPKVTEFFTSLNLPMPAQTAVARSCVGFFGRIFLAVGPLSPVAALVFTPYPAIAYITARRAALGSFFFRPSTFSASSSFSS